MTSTDGIRLFLLILKSEQNILDIEEYFKDRDKNVILTKVHLRPAAQNCLWLRSVARLETRVHISCLLYALLT